MQAVRQHVADRRISGCAARAPGRHQWPRCILQASSCWPPPGAAQLTLGPLPCRFSRVHHAGRVQPCAAAPSPRNAARTTAAAHSNEVLRKVRTATPQVQLAADGRCAAMCVSTFTTALRTLWQVATGAASLALAISLAAASWPAAAPAVTTEQLLFLEVCGLTCSRPKVTVLGTKPDCLEFCLPAQAWRAVDRAYVDKSFNGQSWFKASADSLHCVSAAQHAILINGLAEEGSALL